MHTQKVYRISRLGRQITGGSATDKLLHVLNSCPNVSARRLVPPRVRAASGEMESRRARAALCLLKNGSALECSWATLFPPTVKKKKKKVIYLVFGGLSARAWDFIGCNLILNCSATYTFHSRGGDTRRSSSIKGWHACQSSVPEAIQMCCECQTLAWIQIWRAMHASHTGSGDRWEEGRKRERERSDFHVHVTWLVLKVLVSLMDNFEVKSFTPACC